MRPILLGLALALFLAAPAAAAPRLVPIGDFDQPVYVATPPDNSRIFVVEKRGQDQARRRRHVPGHREPHRRQR